MSKKLLVTRDLLSWRPSRSLLLWSGFPLLLQAGLLLVVAALIVNGLGLGADLATSELKLFRKTNLTTLLVWGLWWPGLIALTLGLGRVWCTVCPLELVNRMADAVARRIGWPRARLGRLLRAGWITLAIFVVLQLFVVGIDLYRVPHFTAIMLMALLGLALLSGLVYRHPRSFCAGFCPASALLSVYGRFTALQLSNRDGNVCDECDTKDCVREENRHRLDRRSCPSLLRPYRRERSDGCVLCFQCARVCPHDNVGFGVVSDAAPVGKRALLRPFEAGFVMFAFGYVAHKVIGEVKWLDHYVGLVPRALHSLVPGFAFSWIDALWFLVLFPLGAWALIAAAGRILGHRGGLRTLLLATATGAAPVVAVAHLAKAMAKIASWGGFLPGAMSDPQGVETFRRIGEGALQSPARLLGLSAIGWLMLGLMAVITWRAWVWSRRMPVELKLASRVGMIASVALFSTVLAIWVLT